MSDRDEWRERVKTMIYIISAYESFRRNVQTFLPYKLIAFASSLYDLQKSLWEHATFGKQRKLIIGKFQRNFGFVGDLMKW